MIRRFVSPLFVAAVLALMPLAAHAQTQTQAQPQPQPAATAKPFKTVPSNGWDPCAKACASDKGCKLAELDGPAKKCNLYGVATISGPLGGVAPAPQPGAANGRMEVKTNTYVEGPGYLVRAPKTPAQCHSDCLSDTKCKMVEYYKPHNKCNMYDHARASGASRDGDVGLKVAK